LTYTHDAPDPGFKGVHIVASDFFGTLYGTVNSLPPLPLPVIENTPLLFGDPDILRFGDCLVVRADIVASSFFLLTRYEEWIRRDVRDHFGRFPGIESLPYRAGFIDRPIVDEYALLLRSWARQVGVELPEPSRRFSVLLTHDVDELFLRWRPVEMARSIAKGIIGRQSWRSSLRQCLLAANPLRDPLNNIGEVIEMDRRLVDSFGAEMCGSVFFFMTGGKNQNGRRYRSYRITSGRVRRSMKLVQAAGAALGLHASFEAGENADLVSSERASLERVAGAPIFRNRHHYLRWREIEDGEAIASAGITWDSSLGYSNVAGFRLGVCHPITLFDPIRARSLAIEEHPLIVMDVSLSSKIGMGLNEETAERAVRKFAETTRRHQGEFVMLWHNAALSSWGADYHRRLYRNMLDWLAAVLDGDRRQCIGRS